MDFYRMCTREIEKGPKKGTFELYPDFQVGPSKDLMIRGKAFYAIWDEAAGMWSTNEYDVQRLVDEELAAYAEEQKTKYGMVYTVKYLRSFGNNGWKQFKSFCQQVSDNAHQLDQTLTFANTEVKKTDYRSKRLPYALVPGDISAWDELVGTLYAVDQRAKIEWIIGAIVAGDSKKIQKFGVFYGPPGKGKGTILNVIEALFDGYTTAFDAKALGSASKDFATEAFRHGPLVAIQGDGDLSKIEDNAKLNTIVSHEKMTMSEKFKSSYTSVILAFLLMGTNQPVKISDAKSGLLRRLIDIHPTGVMLEENHYNTLVSKIDFELGAIASHCLEVYRGMGRHYYSKYRPLEMMLQTDVFFNFIESAYDIFREQDGTTIKQAYTLYKDFCTDTGIDRNVLPQHKVREELRNYFDEYKERAVVDGQQVRSYYSGFNANKYKEPAKVANTFSLVIEDRESLLDELFADMPAQKSRTHRTMGEIPEKYWTDEPRQIDGEMKSPKPSQVARTVLADLDTSLLHFVKVPRNHIIIDFDIRDENGNKSLELNLQAASVWPPTYAELSKSGEGIHLHYDLPEDVDVEELATHYSEGIEVKTLLGDASLRRRLTKCNNVPVATLNVKLPIKEKKVQTAQTLKSEKGLRELIARNMRKEIHPGTKPSIDFIKKILDDANADGMAYDVTDLRPKLIAFANNSSNQNFTCLKIVQTMKFKSDTPIEGVDSYGDDPVPESEEVQNHKAANDNARLDNPFVKPDALVFYDVEVYPNLFIVCWKYQFSPIVNEMINPTQHDIEALMKLRLVGFNNRRYDNHILYARFLGHTVEELYKLSQKIIDNDRSGMFPGAYDISYADIYDFSSKKQGLKKFMIELGHHHLEMDIPWDQSVPKEMIPKVVNYCVNDVLGTEATFNARKQDFVARQILAELSGLTVNDTTQKHTARIIFGADRNPQASFVYTDLSKQFEGYTYDHGKSHYRGELVGEGGYVDSLPGMYYDVDIFDVASMHPTSIRELNLFGPYTKNFVALMDARLAIKNKRFDEAAKMLDGKLAPFIVDENGEYDKASAKELSYALKIVINIVYGLTSAKFDNPFRHVRNKDNIVAKRGALFMLDLKYELDKRFGIKPLHIKTDSIKLEKPTDEVKQFVMDFGKEWGYDFEHEATYERFCLVNDAVYIAKYGWHADDDYEPDTAKHKAGTWYAVGAQFQHPYVFKKLFSGEEVVFDDMCETKNVVNSAMYLDFEPDRVNPTVESMQFVGRTGQFTPVTQESGGGVLYRVKDDQRHAVGGTKGYYWMESVMAREKVDANNVQIDTGFFDNLAANAVKTIDKFGDFEKFVE